MMGGCRASFVLVGVLVVGVVGGAARADVPPPPGRMRVDYRFKIEAVPAGMAAVAFPGYDMKTGDSVVPLVAGEEVRSFQGYAPGIHVLAPADAAALAGKDQAAREAWLAAKGRKCLIKVPRVFEVATTTKIDAMTDVLRLQVTADGCTTTLVTTIYAGEGQRGEGGVDADGRRTPPAPFGADLPDVRESGLALAGGQAPVEPKAAPPRTEGGCSLVAEPCGLLGLGLVWVARRRRRG